MSANNQSAGAKNALAMANPTPPAVSEAMREAVARFIGEGRALASAEYHTDRLLSPESPIASEIARLTGDLKAAEDQNEALHVKLAALAPHGSCACSYDKPDDMCSHHSPALAAAEAETARLRAALEAARLALTKVRDFPENYDRDGQSWKVGFAFYCVQNIARAALTSQEQADG